MCTAISFNNYFGRNLDWERDFGECAIILPRSYPLPFRHTKNLEKHLALIGIAKIENNYPLFFDAMNEKGVACAGLNFVGNAVYYDIMPTKTNVASFEFIPYILTHSESVLGAKKLLKEINITHTPFSDNMPPSQLHFIIADSSSSITVESTKDGLHVYDNPVGVLANNPEFPWQMTNLNSYLNLTNEPAISRFSKSTHLEAFSRGMGAIGLPGDTSSPSRFVRGAFIKENSPTSDISQFFHLLTCTEQVLGATRVESGEYEMTEYSSAYDKENFLLYYTTYTNRRITAIDTKKYDLDGHTLLSFPLRRAEEIFYEN